jgi:translation elongation factor P/translation initiation factor 5A
MDVVKEEVPRLDLSQIENIKKNIKIDVALIDEFVQHMNRVYDRDPEGFLMDNGSYTQIGLIKKQMQETMIDINQVMGLLVEFKNFKTKLEQINKCIIFEYV